ncbi:ribosomal protein L34 [Gregarina niphandrodes]|uniref:Ribosomal protein L34 n=1 Tax=Gregarina niphandrodes TaxID=110365 RepID=A0A023AXA0_GRENI|nr:ribosomal protein L34 [Gregarina niphandrodes]EZG43222.1 ribosomal protein L34 [Gregarina niphandrodes]|eukprot:XP_011133522.1 ribosomal protein L34 [Gregarina niphandrodes]
MAALNQILNRSRSTYRTRTNKTKLVRTPGNRLARHRIAPKHSVPHCPISGLKLSGLPGKPRSTYGRMPKCQRSVARAYGGHFSHRVVREKILKAFFTYEKMCVQSVMLEKARSQKAATKKR